MTLIEKISNCDFSKNTAFSAMQKLALDNLKNNGLPSTKDERWKFTNIQELNKALFSLINQSEETKPEINLNKLLKKTSYKIVFINGKIAKDLSTIDVENGDISIADLSDINNKKSLQGLAKLSTSRTHLLADNPLLNLNSAMISDGVAIRVNKNKTINQPIYLVFITTEDQNEKIIPLRNIIQLEENSEAKIIEHFISEGSHSYLTNTVTEIFCGKSSRVEHDKIQVESKNSYHLASLYVDQEEKSHFKSNYFAFGSKLSRNEIYPTLSGENIETLLNGLTIISGKQHIDNFTVIDHARPNCFSRELYKGIYSDHSSGVFSGTIIVRPDAQKTNAIQSNKAILLSDNASINSNPQLKIFADDVKCTHGATVGQLDDEAMFYLLSRGINKSDAQKMLVRAFAENILEEISIEEMKDLIAEQLNIALS